MSPAESAFRPALELSEKDGSIVVSAGSIFVTAGVKMVCKKMGHPKDMEQNYYYVIARRALARRPRHLRLGQVSNLYHYGGRFAASPLAAARARNDGGTK